MLSKFLEMILNLFKLLTLCGLVAISITATTILPIPSHARYIIIGAGPGGLQIAHYLESAKRDYVVLESSLIAGSFFESFPRWRQLISINKAETGKDSLDFNLRHDWNSLLSEPSHVWDVTSSSTNASRLLDVNARKSGLYFRSYSEAYYPEAERLVSYLQDWADGTPGKQAYKENFKNQNMNMSNQHQHRHRSLRVFYNSSVVQISRAQNSLIDSASNSSSGARFLLSLFNGLSITCHTLIIATGLQEVVPSLGVNAAEALGRRWITSYSNASTNLDDYRGKSLLLLGRGNAAFEFANNVLEVASLVHLLGRAGGRVRLAAETHYPGDVRSVHSHLLETYLLKSMDGMAEIPLEHLRFGFNEVTKRTTIEDVYSPCSHDDFGRQVSRCFFKREYDFVISCPGWRFANNLFDPDVRPRLHTNNKHPALTPRFESANVPGLFFAGTLMHGNDHKKSSGGFIHGFRYLIRALHRILEEIEVEGEESTRSGVDLVKNSLTVSVNMTIQEAVQLQSLETSHHSFTPPFARWPRTDLRGCGLRGLVAAVLRRINLASGPYQMFGGLVDVIVFDPLLSEDVAGFSSVGTIAALHEPWSFPLKPGNCVNVAANDVFSPLFIPRPKIESIHPSSAIRAESDAAIERALRARLFEEVPAKLAADRATAWMHEDGPSSASVSSFVTSPDFVTISLEFGTGSSSHVPEGQRYQDIDITSNVPAYMRARGEWPRDPYSRLRANVGLHNPETSHFLHPVLRFYHQGSNETNTSVKLELHIIEDFHIDWTHHTAHILPIARFFQDIGARRAAAASSSTSRLLSSSVLSNDLSTLWHRPETRPSTFASLLSHIMSRHEATLYYRGEVVRGCEGWMFALSVQAEDDLMHQPEPLLAVHVISTSPYPLSIEERAFTSAVRAQSRAQSGGLSFFEARNISLASDQAPRPPSPQSRESLIPVSGKDAEAMQSGLMKHLDTTYRTLSSHLSGLPLVLYTPRVGESAILAEDFGVDPSLPPTLIVYGASIRTLGVDKAKPGIIFGRTPIVQLDGTDLQGISKALEAAWMMQRREGDDVKGNDRKGSSSKRISSSSKGSKG